MRDLIPPPSTLPAGAIVWGYLRDSGGEAQEQSVGQQERALTAYCTRHGLRLARLYADEARTGGTDKGRDEFLEMIDATARPEQKPVGLLIWSLARFARNPNDAPYYRAILRKRGIVIHSLTEILPEDDLAPLVEAVYDFTNAEKLRQTSRDVKRGLHDLARQGFAPGGFPPRGYKAEKVTIGHKRNGFPRVVSRWVVDEDIAPLVQQAWTMAAQGFGTKQIIQATGGRLYKSKACFSTFFANKTYLGILKCGDEEIEGVVPALISHEIWEAVQRLRQVRSKSRQHSQPRRGLLSSLAHCPICGSAMDHSNNQRWRYYVCGRKVREGAAACAAKRIGANKTEARILDRVMGRVFTASMAATLINEVQAQLSDTSVIDRELARLGQEIANLKRRLSHLNDQIEHFGPSLSVQEQIVLRESELASKETELAQAQAHRSATEITMTPEALAFVINRWARELGQARESDDLLAMQRLLRQFVARIDLGYDTINIVYKFPVSDGYSFLTASPWGHH